MPREPLSAYASSMAMRASLLLFFFFQAEDGIRDIGVTGVKTCALPICRAAIHRLGGQGHQLPDRRLRRLRVAARPRLCRPRALHAEGLGQGPGPLGRGACAGGVTFATKPRLALGMAERAIAAGVPFAWVAADTAYGTGEVEMALRRAGKGYVLGANATQPFNSWIGKPVVAGTAEEIARGLDPAAWRRLSAGEGTKGPRLSDWAYLELADLDADEYRDGATGVWTRGLLVRRGLADGECAFFSTWCPAGTTMETLVAVEGKRWAVEDAFETAKTELGLDHNETRSWHGWHRHVSSVMLAFAMLARVRRHANRAPPPKASLRLPRTPAPSCAGRSGRSVASRPGSRSGASSPPTSSPGRSGDARTKPPRDAAARRRRATLTPEAKNATVMLRPVSLTVSFSLAIPY